MYQTSSDQQPQLPEHKINTDRKHQDVTTLENSFSGMPTELAGEDADEDVEDNDAEQNDDNEGEDEGDGDGDCDDGGRE